MVRRTLTPKQEAFVREYLVDLNAAAAARRAGYSKDSASYIGYQLLQNPIIAERIRVAMDERARRLELSADRVLKEVARIALFDPRKLLNADGIPKAIADLDDDTAAAVAGIDVSEEREGGRLVGYTRKVRLNDKNVALHLAMRHLGMLNDKIEVKTTSDRAARLEAARRRMEAKGK